MQEKLAISTIVKASICPRLVYFGEGENMEESERYIVRKQISYHLGGVLEQDEIWNEILLVRPGIDPAMREYLNSGIRACRNDAWRSASGHDLVVSSEKYGMVGRVDRVFDEPPFFSIIRARQAQKYGISLSDRLRISACMICMREDPGLPAENGVIEYLETGTMLTCTPEPRDIRRLLSAVRSARTAVKGEIPARPPNAPCQGCSYRLKCDPGPRRLSDLFRTS
ncbi:MAG: Dna2/Cas4 domain-containing protein [Methanoregulaceae archaeon]|nr:Dna2/Cas4 domain-containing protein [Methanoregulaceae archaeon]